MGSSEAERLGEACQRLHERVHAEVPLSDEEKSELSYLLGITAGQASRIEQQQARIAELSDALQLLSGVRVS